MKLPTEIFGTVVVIHTPDEISAEQTPLLARILASQDRSNVIVDLDGTESIDSSALNMLLDAQDTLREVGGDLRIATTNNNNRKILEITRLNQRLEIFDNVLDAVKSFA
jgi:anti-sigma B factor antagonist